MKVEDGGCIPVAEGESCVEIRSKFEDYPLILLAQFSTRKSRNCGAFPSSTPSKGNWLTYFFRISVLSFFIFELSSWYTLFQWRVGAGARLRRPAGRRRANGK